MKITVNSKDRPFDFGFKIFYEHYAHRYWVEEEDGIYLSITVSEVHRRLLQMNLSASREYGASEIDDAILKFQRECKVDYAGQVAGWPNGCYNSGNKKLLISADTPMLKPTYGGSTVIKDFRERLYGPEQAPIMHAWTKLAIEYRRRGEERIKSGQPPRWPIHQALCVIGPKSHGKTVDSQIDLMAIGGPYAKAVNPAQSHSGDTSFNEDLAEEVFHLMDDEGGRDDYSARRRFGEEIKKSVASVSTRVHGKGKKAIVLDPCVFTRIAINDRLEDIRVLPPMDTGLGDKFILLKTVGFGVDPNDGYDFQTRMDYYMAGVSDYMGWLETWEIPDEIKDPERRYGIDSFHNKDVIASLMELGSESSLIGILMRIPEMHGKCYTSSEMFSMLLEGALGSRFRTETLSIAKNPIVFGKIVASAAERCPHILVAQSRVANLSQQYKIEFPGPVQLI